MWWVVDCRVCKCERRKEKNTFFFLDNSVHIFHFYQHQKCGINLRAVFAQGKVAEADDVQMERKLKAGQSKILSGLQLVSVGGHKKSNPRL